MPRRVPEQQGTSSNHHRRGKCGTELNGLLIIIINEHGGSWALQAGNPTASPGEVLGLSAGSLEPAGCSGAGLALMGPGPTGVLTLLPACLTPRRVPPPC